MLDYRIANNCTKESKAYATFGSMPRSDGSLTCTPKYASQAEMYLLGY